MWEYSISFNVDNILCAKFVYNKLKEISKEFGSIVTTYEQDNYINVLVAAEDFDKIRMQYAINDVIIHVITNQFKEKFLEKYLTVPITDKINYSALTRALVNFDKETDIHLIQKYLTVENNIFVESFFDFKLISLKNKWMELTKLANDNSTYLMCDDTFIELLKFLIDNIEICYDQVNVIVENNKFKICDNSFNEIIKDDELELSNEIAFITNLISLCPKIINVYCDNEEKSQTLNLMCQIFDSRIKILPTKILAKNS